MTFQFGSGLLAGGLSPYSRANNNTGNQQILMAKQAKKPQKFNVYVIGQNGRLMYEALIFAASLRHSDPDFSGQIFIAEPQKNDLWNGDPTIRDDDVRALAL